MFTPTNDSPTLSAFLVDEGVDLVYRAGTAVSRIQLPYTKLSGVINGKSLTLAFSDSEEDLDVVYGDLSVTLKLQPKGHFFAPIRDRAPRRNITLAEARRRAMAAAKATDAAPAANTRKRSKTKAADQPLPPNAGNLEDAGF